MFRLEEDAFTEPTQTYYNQEIKAIKFKRDALIKVTHEVIYKYCQKLKNNLEKFLISIYW